MTSINEMQKTLLSSELTHKNSFDFLRFLFALSVVFGHYYVLTNKLDDCFWPISTPMAVSGFFIISGFLITWSYCNNNDLKTYLKKRAKRIMPAYYTVVILCALLFCLISAFSLKDYFCSIHFLKYLTANISFMNFIEPQLPGVFINNYMDAVNGALWTIKVEIALYLSVPVYCFLIRKKMDTGMLCIFIYVISIAFSIYCNFLFDKTGNNMYNIIGRQFIGQFKYFISGAVILFYYDIFRKYFKVLFISALVIFFIHYFKMLSHNALNVVIDILYPISFAALIIGIAFNFKYLNNFGKYGDFSYGIYLIHFPVIQTLIHFKIHEYNFIATLFLSIIITITLAALSWHLIEKHFLKRK